MNNTQYIVIWDNGCDCGTLRGTFATKKEAQSAGREWKRGMVDAECTAYDRKVAREEYSFEVEEAR